MKAKREGNLKMEQHQTSKVRTQARAIEAHEVFSLVSRPKAMFFLAAVLSFFMSVYLFFSGDHERGIFVGIWVPSILSAGALLLAGGKDD
jgi:hypothetical protein